MKNKRINKKVPAYALGVGDYYGIGQLAGTGLQAFGSADQYGAPNGTRAAGNVLGTAASLGTAGLSVGGPIGGAIGAGIGAITGLFGNRAAKRRAEEAERRRNNQIIARDSMVNSANLVNEYYTNNDVALTYADGGIIPNNLAYLDNGEIVRDVLGNISQVPNNSVGTDQHLVDATGLESVLSNKLKRPGTNRTFAQEGEVVKQMKKPSKWNDRFAQNTDALNSANADRLYNELLEEQSQEQIKKGTKQKTKTIPKYANGLTPEEVSFYAAYNGPEIVVTPNGGVRDLNSLSMPDSLITRNANYNFLPSQPLLDYTGPAAGTRDLSTTNNGNGNGNGNGRTTGINNTSSTLGNLGNNLLSLAPTIYNTIQSLGTPETEAPLTNPYTSSITSALSRRRLNTRPIREANSRTRAIANYNASNLNPSTGANLALRSQLASTEYQANSDLESMRQNAMNQYLGEYANVLGNLGQQYNASVERTNEINAANRAAQRNYASAAATQISQWAQNRQLMNNQASRDDLVYPLLENLLSEGYDSATIDEIRRRYYNN